MARVIPPPKPEQRCVTVMIDDSPEPVCVEAYVTEPIDDVVKVALFDRGIPRDIRREVFSAGGIRLEEALSGPVDLLVESYGLKLFVRTSEATS